jgi:hypothetical protein
VSLLLTLSLIFGLFEQGMVRARELAADAPRDAHEGITISAEAYDNDLIGRIGNKQVVPNTALPVYLAISNPTKDALNLNAMSVTLEGGDGLKYSRVAGADVEQWFRAVSYKNGKLVANKRAPGGITDQEFLVKMVPAGDTIRGFVYFRDPPKSAAGLTLYLNGLKWASSGKELLFFEIHFPEPKGPEPERKP